MARQQAQLGKDLQDVVVNKNFVLEFPIDNRAQQGGETIGMAVDLAMAGKGINTGSAKMLAKNADELAVLDTRQADEFAVESSYATDDLVRLSNDIPNNIQIRKAPPHAQLNQADIDRFSFNHETARTNIAEGIGTARAAAVLDGDIRRPETNDLGVDFYIDDAPVSLKAPLLNGTSGADQSISGEMVKGLAKSVVKHVRLISATDTIVIDTLKCHLFNVNSYRQLLNLLSKP